MQVLNSENTSSFLNVAGRRSKHRRQLDARASGPVTITALAHRPANYLQRRQSIQRQPGARKKYPFAAT